MITTNLSTRPFYNEGAVRVLLALVAGLALVATALNVTRVLYYSRSDTELKAAAARDEAEAVELRNTATDLRASVDLRQIDAVSVEARQANELIDRRVFSWTALFNQFEATLPPDVRLTSVSPRVNDAGQFTIAMVVLARGVDDVNEFLDNLEDTGAFRGPLSRQERVNEAGLLQAAIETVYVTEGGVAP